MPSLSGFIRKSPAARLRHFFEARHVPSPVDFDWTSEGTDLVRSVAALMDALPDRQQDQVKAEFELLASLSDDHGMTAAVQICGGQDIDLEGSEGVEDVLLKLATEFPEMIDRVNAQTSMMRRHGGKQWARFQFPDDGKSWELDQQSARDGFLEDVVDILELPAHRKREADWYNTVRTDPKTGREVKLTHATVYVEEHAQSELAFGESSLERQTVRKVVEVGLFCDPNERMIEICAKGGKKLRDQYLKSFTKNFAPASEAPIEVPRRDVLLDTLRQAPEFVTEPSDLIDRVEVSSLSFRSPDGGFARIEKRGEDETIYQYLDRQFGPASPLRTGGWQVLSATLRIMLVATEGKRARTMTVTLTAPNTTTLPNKTDADRQFVFGLLERWILLAPAPTHEDLFEVVE